MRTQRFWTCCLWFFWGVLCVTVLTLSCRHECLIMTGAITTNPKGAAAVFMGLTMACVFLTIILASRMIDRYMRSWNDDDNGGA